MYGPVRTSESSKRLAQVYVGFPEHFGSSLVSTLDTLSRTNGILNRGLSAGAGVRRAASSSARCNRSASSLLGRGATHETNTSQEISRSPLVSLSLSLSLSRRPRDFLFLKRGWFFCFFFFFFFLFLAFIFGARERDLFAVLVLGRTRRRLPCFFSFRTATDIVVTRVSSFFYLRAPHRRLFPRRNNLVSPPQGRRAPRVARSSATSASRDAI